MESHPKGHVRATVLEHGAFRAGFIGF